MLLLILTLFFALLISIFAIQNAAPVAIKLFWISTQVPLVLVILGSVLAGALIVVLIVMWSKIHPKKKNKTISNEPIDEKNINSTEHTIDQEQATEKDKFDIS